MKIKEQTGTRLVLSGVPGGWGWMLFAAVLGTALTAAVVAAGIYEINRGSYGNLLWIGLGLVIAQAVFWTGTITLAVGRERLELDRTTGTGRYGVRSPIVETGAKPFGFDLADVDSVSFEMRVERTPGSAAREGVGTHSEVWSARLRVSKPRRAVTLDSSENNQDARVRAVAEAVAEFLGVGLADATGADEPERRGSPDALATPLARRGGVDGLDVPAQPGVREWDLSIEPGRERVVITAARAGGAPVLGCFLVLLTLIWALAGVVSVAAWLPGQTFNGTPISTELRILIAAPGVLGLPAVALAWVALLRGRRRVIIDPQRVTTRWIFPGRRIVDALPGVSALARRGASVPTGAVTSVRSIKTQAGRAVEIRAPGGALRVGSRLPDEDDEKASLAWLASAVRAGVRALGADA